MSLHTQPGDAYLDDDAPELEANDLPPLYSDIEDLAAAGSSSSSAAAPLLSDPTLPGSGIEPATSFLRDGNTGATYYVDRRLDEDASVLQFHVEELWGLAPPRPSVRLHGTHWREVREGGKTKRERVTDFDVRVDLTPYLFSDAAARHSWRRLRTVENGERARRGGMFRSRAPGAVQSIEVGAPDKPTLREWCHRYCASHAGLKTFQLRRRVVGFDEAKVRQKLEWLVRNSNYRGRLEIGFPVTEQTAELLNDCRTNRWRLTPWVRWLVTLTLMFLFTWPYLFLRTKRFETVVVEWPFSQPGAGGRVEYVSVSEEEWYNLWARAILKAVLERQQRTLDQQDLMAGACAEPTFDSGHEGVNNALRFVRAGVNAMNEVNRSFRLGRR